MSATDIALNQPVIAGGESRTFFFNGRLLSAEDLRREQAQREAGQRRLAQLLGCGIATGLNVTGKIGQTTLSIAQGLGITPSGEVIDVGDLQLDLQAAAGARRVGGFSDCEAAFNSGPLSAGLHLLVLTPTWIGDGRAPTLLGEVGACNRNIELPAVRARLVKLNQPAGSTPITLRNRLAYALLAPIPGVADNLIGWWPSGMAPTLGRDDLPLAVVTIDDQAQVEFLDVDAARRRLAPPPGNAADALQPESRVVEMEAFARQFPAQLLEIAETSAEKLAEQAAAFDWLPPVVLLDATARTRYGAVFAKAGTAALPKVARIVGRENFARALHGGLYGEPVERTDAQATLLRLFGSQRWLLRLRPAKDPDNDTGQVIGGGRNERTSRRVAAMAGKVLRDPDASSEERSLAASALTQAPDKPTRKRSPRTPG
ncbi:MAG: hypothetical protein U1F76_06925 [Candidatus Competibacteraceae bacterium]